jgi:hypothetical protein
MSRLQMAERSAEHRQLTQPSVALRRGLSILVEWRRASKPVERDTPRDRQATCRRRRRLHGAPPSSPPQTPNPVQGLGHRRTDFPMKDGFLSGWVQGLKWVGSWCQIDTFYL